MVATIDVIDLEEVLEKAEKMVDEKAVTTVAEKVERSETHLVVTTAMTGEKRVV